MMEPAHSSMGPRICHVVYGRYPADPRVRKETQTLARLGYTLDVLCVRQDGSPNRENEGAIRIQRLPLHAVRGSRARYAYQYALFSLLVGAKLTFVSLTRRYRVIHIHSLPDFLVFSAFAAHILGTRVILDLHESMPHLYLARFGRRPGSLVHCLTRVAQRLSSMLADEVLTVNPVLAAVLHEDGVPSKKITIIENSPDWHAPPVAPAASISNTEAVMEVVIVGGLNRERDLVLVLRAVKEVSRTHKIRLRIVGPGDPTYVSQLRRAVSDLELDQLVQLGPEVPQSEVRQLLDTTAIGIVSYQRNPLTEIATPNKAYEYATIGKPMVVADLPGLRSLLDDSVLYYRPGDSDSLARAIAQLKDDSALRETLAQRVYGVAQEHRWEIMAQRLGTLYNQLCRGSANPEGQAHHA